MQKSPKICIIGAEGWGSAISTAICKNVSKDGQASKVHIYVYDEFVQSSYLSEVINKQHENIKYLPGIKLPTNLFAVNDLVVAAKNADVLIFATHHNFIKSYCNILEGKLKSTAYAVSLVKGLEHIRDGEIDLYSHAISNQLEIPCYSIMNANSAMEMAQGKLCEITIGCNNAEHTKELTELFQTENCMVFTTDDVDGVELCNTLKDLVALCAGVIDGLRLGENARIACLHLGIKEMIRFIKNFNPATKVSTFFESCGLANLVASSYVDKNVTFAKYLVSNRKTIQEIEANLVSGRKLLGPIVAEEIYVFLEKQGLHETYPLFSIIHRICEKDVAPHHIIEVLRNHPDLNNSSVTQLQEEENANIRSSVILDNVMDTIPQLGRQELDFEKIAEEPIKVDDEAKKDGFWKPYHSYFNNESIGEELNEDRLVKAAYASLDTDNSRDSTVEYSFEMGKEKPEIFLQLKEFIDNNEAPTNSIASDNTNQNPLDTQLTNLGKLQPLKSGKNNPAETITQDLGVQNKQAFNALKVRVAGKSNEKLSETKSETINKTEMNELSDHEYPKMLKTNDEELNSGQQDNKNVKYDYNLNYRKHTNLYKFGTNNTVPIQYSMTDNSYKTPADMIDPEDNWYKHNSTFQQPQENNYEVNANAITCMNKPTKSNEEKTTRFVKQTDDQEAFVKLQQENGIQVDYKPREIKDTNRVEQISEKNVENNEAKEQSNAEKNNLNARYKIGGETFTLKELKELGIQPDVVELIKDVETSEKPKEYEISTKSSTVEASGQEENTRDKSETKSRPELPIEFEYSPKLDVVLEQSALDDRIPNIIEKPVNDKPKYLSNENSETGSDDRWQWKKITKKDESLPIQEMEKKQDSQVEKSFMLNNHQFQNKIPNVVDHNLVDEYEYLSNKDDGTNKSEASVRAEIDGYQQNQNDAKNISSKNDDTNMGVNEDQLRSRLAILEETIFNLDKVEANTAQLEAEIKNEHQRVTASIEKTEQPVSKEKLDRPDTFGEKRAEPFMKKEPQYGVLSFEEQQEKRKAKAADLEAKLIAEDNRRANKDYGPVQYSYKQKKTSPEDPENKKNDSYLNKKRTKKSQNKETSLEESNINQNPVEKSDFNQYPMEEKTIPNEKQEISNEKRFVEHSESENFEDEPLDERWLEDKQGQKKEMLDTTLEREWEFEEERSKVKQITSKIDEPTALEENEHLDNWRQHTEVVDYEQRRDAILKSEMERQKFETELENAKKARESLDHPYAGDNSQEKSKSVWSWLFDKDEKQVNEQRAIQDEGNQNTPEESDKRMQKNLRQEKSTNAGQRVSMWPMRNVEEKSEQTDTTDSQEQPINPESHVNEKILPQPKAHLLLDDQEDEPPLRDQERLLQESHEHRKKKAIERRMRDRELTKKLSILMGKDPQEFDDEQSVKFSGGDPYVRDKIMPRLPEHQKNFKKITPKDVQPPINPRIRIPRPPFDGHTQEYHTFNFNPFPKQMIHTKLMANPRPAVTPCRHPNPRTITKLSRPAIRLPLTIMRSSMLAIEIGVFAALLARRRENHK